MRIYGPFLDARVMTGSLPLVPLCGDIAGRVGYVIHVSDEQSADEIIRHSQVAVRVVRLDELERERAVHVHEVDGA